MLHAVSVEVIAAVSCPAVIKVVALGVMPQYMTEPDVKLLPLTIKVNAWPAVALFGMRLVMTGAAPPPVELDFLV
jgi:hypothetical protein